MISDLSSVFLHWTGYHTLTLVMALLAWFVKIFWEQLSGIIWDKILVPTWKKVTSKKPAPSIKFSPYQFGLMKQEIKDLKAWKRGAQKEFKLCAEDRAACLELRHDYSNLILRVATLESKREGTS